MIISESGSLINWGEIGVLNDGLASPSQCGEKLRVLGSKGVNMEEFFVFVHCGQYWFASVLG